MRFLNPLICLACVLTAAPLVAGDYQDLHPSSGSAIKEAPTNLIYEAIETYQVSILSVDQKSHMVTFKRPDGATQTIVAKDLALLKRIKAGDKVDVTVTTASDIDLITQEDIGKPGVQTEAATLSSAKGSTPARAEGEAIYIVIKITSVDPYKKTISFIGPRGTEQEVSLDTPAMRPYLKKLKEGDSVRLVKTKTQVIARESR